MRFPNYRQMDTMDCGPACLKSIAQYYGKSYSLDMLREKCHITHNGVSMMGICDAASDMGFRTLGVKLTWRQLKKEANLPCIVHWNRKHFVVVYKIKKKRNGSCIVYNLILLADCYNTTRRLFCTFGQEDKMRRVEAVWG